MFKLRFALPLLATIPAAHAQQLPSAGTQLQQLPAAPVAPRATPDIAIDRPVTTLDATDAGPAILVSALHIDGQTAFPEAELRAATGFVSGSQLTLAQLRML